MPDLRTVILLGIQLTGLTCGALVMAMPASADTLPASVRACIGEADRTRRLDCYDREVARAIAPPDTFTSNAPEPPVAVAPAVPARSAAPAASVPLPTAAAAAPPSPAAAAPAGPPRHLTARVSAVRQSGDDLIVTLDNGEVWEQSVSGTSPLNLRPGDVVKLDRGIGSWFLSNQYGDNIQVRPRKP